MLGIPVGGANGVMKPRLHPRICSTVLQYYSAAQISQGHSNTEKAFSSAEHCPGTDGGGYDARKVLALFEKRF